MTTGHNNEKLEGLLYWSAKHISGTYSEYGFAEVVVWPERQHGPHLIMRLENQLFLIYIEIEIDGFVENIATKEAINTLVNMAKNINGIPSYIKVCLTISGDNMHATIENVDNIINLSSNQYVDLNNLDYNELVEISEWELLDFATQIAIKNLIDIGHNIERYDTRPEREAPFVISSFNGEIFQCFICASRIGDIVPSIKDDLRTRIALLTKINDIRVLVAPITISNIESFENEETVWKPLYRGKPAVARRFEFEDLTVFDKRNNKNQ